jgi:hypothetical protein
MVEMFFKKENMTEKSFSPIVAQYYKMIAMAAWQHGSTAAMPGMPAGQLCQQGSYACRLCRHSCSA